MFLSYSFIGVILIPLFLYLWMGILIDFFKYMRYRVTRKPERIQNSIAGNEKPILVLEYNNEARIKKAKIGLTVFVLGFVICFFTAAHDARSDMHRVFLSFNEGQTYILYYWTWKFICSFGLLFFVLQSIKFFGKRVIFFKNYVVIENSITGKRGLPLDNNIRRNKGPVVDWLYDPQRGINLPVFDKRFMILTPDQEKLLDEILNGIPLKKVKMREMVI